MKRIVNGIEAEIEPIEAAGLQAEWDINLVNKAANQYKEDRQAAHIPIADQLDMIYWDKINSTTIWLDYVTNIKTLISKP